MYSARQMLYHRAALQPWNAFLEVTINFEVDVAVSLVCLAISCGHCSL
jgi:hypothetical protein